MRNGFRNHPQDLSREALAEAARSGGLQPRSPGMALARLMAWGADFFWLVLWGNTTGKPVNFKSRNLQRTGGQLSSRPRPDQAKHRFKGAISTCQVFERVTLFDGS